MSADQLQPRAKKRRGQGPARSMREAFKTGQVTKMTVDMDSDLHRRLKFKALEEGRTMKEIIEECVDEYLGR